MDKQAGVQSQQDRMPGRVLKWRMTRCKLSLQKMSLAMVCKRLRSEAIVL